MARTDPALRDGYEVYGQEKMVCVKMRFLKKPPLFRACFTENPAA
jgi:hypothetical protein